MGCLVSAKNPTGDATLPARNTIVPGRRRLLPGMHLLWASSDYTCAFSRYELFTEFFFSAAELSLTRYLPIAVRLL